MDINELALFLLVRYSLRELNLSFTRMTSRGLQALATASRMELKKGSSTISGTSKGLLFLKRLSLRGNEKLTMDDSLFGIPSL